MALGWGWGCKGGARVTGVHPGSHRVWGRVGLGRGCYDRGCPFVTGRDFGVPTVSFGCNLGGRKFGCAVTGCKQ